MALFAHSPATIGSRLYVRLARLCSRAHFFLAVGALVFWAVASTSFAQSPAGTASEEQVKAAYLYKLLNYVEWPAYLFGQSAAPYVIGVIDAEGVADELAKISRGRLIKQRAVVIKKLDWDDAPTGVHLLFAGGTGRGRFAPYVKSVQSRPILIATDFDGALRHGSMINFVSVDDRIRLEVSVDEAEQAGLKLSSRLMAIAVNVVKESQR